MQLSPKERQKLAKAAWYARNKKRFLAQCKQQRKDAKNPEVTKIVTDAHQPVQLPIGAQKCLS